MSEEKTTTIHRDGELSIRNAADLVTDLETALRDSAAVIVDFDAITGADITILQILVAAHRTAARRGVKLSIPVPQDGVLSIALARSGMLAAPDAKILCDNGAWTGIELTHGEKAA